MTRRPSGRQSHAAEIARGPKSDAAPRSVEPSHSDRLVAAIDHLTNARRESEAIGESFLSYLIAMAIQEARTAIRGEPSLEAP